MKWTSHQRKNEEGFASLVIALTMILVLALITVSFTQLSRREQQGALDKQLSSRAFSAAESGINDAYADIKDNLITTTNANKKDCMTPTSITTGLPAGVHPRTANPTIDAAKGESYTCLLVDLTPDSLKWTSVDHDTSRTVVFSNDGTGLDSLEIRWASADSHNDPKTSAQTGNFYPASSWGNAPGVVEVMITPLGASTDTTDAGALKSSMRTIYLYPSAGGPNSISFANANGAVVSGNCDTSGSTKGNCKVTITGIGGVAGGYYLARIIDYYDESNVSFNNAKTSGGVAENFTQGQAEIEVTGKAKDALKRLRVRVPLSSAAATVPEYALDAQNVCKRTQTRPNVTDFIGTDGSNVNGGTAPCNAEN